jgi:ATP-dependent Clp protease ATP-binding subunit ClpA
MLPLLLCVATGSLANKRLVALDVGAVVAGSTYRGEFEERLQSLLHDCEAAQGSVVLFIDEIHVLGEHSNCNHGLVEPFSLLL